MIYKLNYTTRWQFEWNEKDRIQLRIWTGFYFCHWSPQIQLFIMCRLLFFQCTPSRYKITDGVGWNQLWLKPEHMDLCLLCLLCVPIRCVSRTAFSHLAGFVVYNSDICVLYCYVFWTTVCLLCYVVCCVLKTEIVYYVLCCIQCVAYCHLDMFTV